MTERPWQATVVALARKFRAPILPMRLVARNSALFHLFSKLSTELRDITLFHELLNKRGRLYEVQIAAPIGPDELAGDATEAVTRLQHYVEHGLRNRAVLRPTPHQAPRPLLAASR
jgi:putative hemolysin